MHHKKRGSLIGISIFTTSTSTKPIKITSDQSYIIMMITGFDTTWLPPSPRVINLVMGAYRSFHQDASKRPKKQVRSQPTSTPSPKSPSWPQLLADFGIWSGKIYLQHLGIPYVDSDLVGDASIHCREGISFEVFTSPKMRVPSPKSPSWPQLLADFGIW